MENGVETQQAGATGKRHLDPVSHIAMGSVGLIASVALWLRVDADVLMASLFVISAALFGVGVIAQGVRIGLNR